MRHQGIVGEIHIDGLEAGLRRCKEPDDNHVNLGTIGQPGSPIQQLVGLHAPICQLNDRLYLERKSRTGMFSVVVRSSAMHELAGRCDCSGKCKTIRNSFPSAKS